MSDVASAPVIMRWEGDNFVPINQRWATACDKQFVVGGVYVLTEHQARSEKSHRHYFASVKEAWKNLTGDVALYFPTSEHLRKYALIRCGFSIHHTIVLKNKKDAMLAASMMRPMNDMDVIVVDGIKVTRFAARSQDTRRMDRDEFQKSKQAVLDFCADLIGVKTALLETHAAHTLQPTRIRERAPVLIEH
jgi:hypothetical protein